jgi:hypothetical protein
METKNEEETKNPTLFYKVFENTLNSLKSNLFSQKTESTPITTHTSSFRTPLENISKKDLKVLNNTKKGVLKGTKWMYLFIRKSEEDIYLWI